MAFETRQEVADLLRLPEQTLRYWERDGLLAKFGEVGPAQYIARARSIRSARENGLSMPDVRRLSEPIKQD